MITFLILTSQIQQPEWRFEVVTRPEAIRVTADKLEAQKFVEFGYKNLTNLNLRVAALSVKTILSNGQGKLVKYSTYGEAQKERNIDFRPRTLYLTPHQTIWIKYPVPLTEFQSTQPGNYLFTFMTSFTCYSTPSSRGSHSGFLKSRPIPVTIYPVPSKS